MVRPAPSGTPQGLDGPALWGVWRSVTRELPVWTMPRDSLFAPSVWGMVGVDYISSLRRNRSTQKIRDLLEPVGDHDLRRVRALGQTNHRRHEAVSRWVAIGFVTLPVSALLALSQLLPEGTDLMSLKPVRNGFATFLFLSLAVLFHLAAAWRARQVATVLDILLIERGLLPDGDDAHDPALSLNLES